MIVRIVCPQPGVGNYLSIELNLILIYRIKIIVSLPCNIRLLKLWLSELYTIFLLLFSLLSIKREILESVKRERNIYTHIYTHKLYRYTMYYYFIKINYLFYKASRLFTHMSHRAELRAIWRNDVYTSGSKISNGRVKGVRRIFSRTGHEASFIVIWRLVANMQAMSWGQ